MSTQSNVAVRKESRIDIRTLVQIGMLSAIAIILMLFEIPLPFAPSFYEIDFSEVPVMIGCFVMGPLAGAAIEFVKILLNFVINGTATAGVGEAANFVIGCALCVPAGIIYKKNHTRNGALIGMLTGTVIMTAAGCFINAYILLPAYGAAFGMPIEALVVPFNLLKGLLVSLIVFIIYKKIRPIFKMR